MAKFAVIYIDPPYRFTVRSVKGMGRSPKYPTMKLADMVKLPVGAIAGQDCVLLMWVTYPCLEQGLALGKAYGFTYKTVAFTWVKNTLQGMRAKTIRIITDDFNWHIGQGYWTRSNAEICMLFTRGKPKRKSKSVRQLIVAPVTRHSEKPSEAYERIEQLLDGPYVELFARRQRAGWVSLGFDADGADIRDSLPALASGDFTTSAAM